MDTKLCTGCISVFQRCNNKLWSLLLVEGSCGQKRSLFTLKGNEKPFFEPPCIYSRSKAESIDPLHIQMSCCEISTNPFFCSLSFISRRRMRADWRDCLGCGCKERASSACGRSTAQTEMWASGSNRNPLASPRPCQRNEKGSQPSICVIPCWRSESWCKLRWIAAASYGIQMRIHRARENKKKPTQ